MTKKKFYRYIEKIRNGDENSSRALYTRYGAAARRAAAGAVTNAGAAGMAVKMLFTDIAKAADEFGPADRPKRWIRRIAADFARQYDTLLQERTLKP